MKRRAMVICLLAAGLFWVITASPSAAPQASPRQAAHYTVEAWPLPDNGAGDVSLEYIAYDRSTNSVRVPGGVSGAIDGVDDIHYAPATHLLYVGAARAAKLTIARANGSGHLTVVAQVPAQKGARNATVASDGTVFLGHPGGTKLSALVVVSPSSK